MTALHPMLDRGILATYRREPPLSFAGGRLHLDPKVGLARFGPASLGLDTHPGTVRLGYVGSGTSIAAAPPRQM